MPAAWQVFLVEVNARPTHNGDELGSISPRAAFNRKAFAGWTVNTDCRVVSSMTVNYFELWQLSQPLIYLLRIRTPLFSDEILLFSNVVGFREKDSQVLGHLTEVFLSRRVRPSILCSVVMTLMSIRFNTPLKPQHLNKSE